MKIFKKLIAIIMVVITCFTMFDYSVLQVEGKPHHNSCTTKSVYEKEGYTVEFSITKQWKNGYSGKVRIYNTGNELIQNWYTGFDYSGELINIWNGCTYYNEDGQYVIKNNGWNQDIPANGFVEFGFVGLGDFAEFPTNCELLQRRGKVQQKNYTIEYSVKSNWNRGFIGEISITNISDTVIEDWELEFDYSRKITNLWNGYIKKIDASDYIISNAMYNSNLKPGETVKIGFVGMGGNEADVLVNVELYSYSPEYVECIELSDGEIDKAYIERAIYPQLILNGLPIDDVKLADDFDNDGLTLIEEYDLDTNPFAIDTDEDNLTDYDEVYGYLTNPLKWDTDEDGLGDGTEIQCGLNPLVKDSDNNGVEDGSETITQTIDVNYIENKNIDDVGTIPSIELTGIGDYSKQIYSLAIENDATILDIECLVGSAYDFIHDDSLNFDYSKLTFTISEALLEQYAINDLAIAWYNEEDNALELLDTVVETDNSISAVVEHYSIYMVVSVSEYMYNIDCSNRSAIIDTGKADVVFVIDTTGSMGSSIQNVKNNIENFVTELEENKVDVRLGLIEYRDINVDGIYSTVNYGWYTYVSNFKDNLAKLEADGGGDTPESAVDALDTARRMNFRKNVDKYIILVTDADYHNGTVNNNNLTLLQEIIYLKEAGINTSVITLPDYYSVYSDLVENTGGVLGSINDDFLTVTENLTNKIGTISNEKCWIRLSNGSIVALDKDPSLGDDTVDTDGDGIPDIIELKTTSTTREFATVNGTIQPLEMWTFYSNPVKSDTDGDGILDVDDLQPTKFDITVIEETDEIIAFNTGRTWNIMEYTANDYLDYLFAWADGNTDNDIPIENVQEMFADTGANSEQEFSIEELTYIGLMNNEGSKVYLSDKTATTRDIIFKNLTGRETKYFQHEGILWWSKWKEVSKNAESGFFKGILTSESELNFSYNIEFKTDVYEVIDGVIVLGAIIISAVIVAKATPVVIANLQAISYYVKNFGIYKGLEMYTYLGVSNLPDGVITWIQMDMADGDSSLDDLVDSGIPIYQRGISGEEMLAKKYPGEPHVYFNTIKYGFKGGRYVDQLSNGVAYEAKVGYTCLSNRVKIQIQKDAYLLKNEEVKGVVWEFYKSDITGRIGATQSLLNYLEQNGIKYNINY